MTIDNSEILISGGIIFILLIISGFFSGSETAMTGASKARMHQLTKQGDKRAKLILSLLEKKDTLIGSILFGNNLVNILASALATNLLIQFFGETGIIYATLAMTMLILIFAEVLPKTWALSNPDRVALFIAPTIRIIVMIFWPITWFVQLVVRSVLWIFGVNIITTIDHDEKEEELRGAIELHEGLEPEIKQERLMLRSILDLDDVDVEEIMTYRSNVEMIDLEDDIKDNIEKLLASNYTRILLMRGNADNILGVLHAKSLLRAIYVSQKTNILPDLEELSSKAWFIPENTTLLDQLQEFRARREHFAIVVDEYGTFMGIVTLEDILEEIVGEIDDENDVEVKGVEAQANNSYIIDGSVTIRDLNRQFDWNLPDDNANTIAGLILHEARIIPEAGQVFNFFGFRFIVLKRQRNQLTSLRVTPYIDVGN